MQYIHGRTEHRSNKLHIVQIHGNIQGRRVHMIDCLWKSHSVLLHWGETELTSLDHSHWWNWKARQLGGGGEISWATFAATGNKDSYPKQILQASNVFLWGKKQQSCSNSLSSVSPDTCPERCLWHFSLLVPPVYYIYMCCVHMCIKT